MVRAALEFCERIKYVNSTYDDTMALGQELGEEGIGAQLARAATFQAVYRLHDILTARINHRNRDEERRDFLCRYHTEEFPPPFLPDNEFIHPVRTFPDILDEGEAMGHCVKIRAEDVMYGRSYIYRVLAPERATLELDREGGIISIGECKGEKNSPISQPTATAILDWFEGEMGKQQANLRPGEKMGA